MPFISSIRASPSSGETRTTNHGHWKLDLPSAIYQGNLDRRESNRLAELYDALSGSYEALYGEEQSPKHDQVIKLLGSRRFRTLLDIGCGNGTFLLRAESMFENGIGIDISTKMLQTAKNKNKKIDYIHANAASLPIRGGSVDCVVSVSMVQANANLPIILDDFERIGTNDSIRAITIFQESETINPPNIPSNYSAKLSERETLHLFRS